MGSLLKTTKSWTVEELGTDSFRIVFSAKLAARNSISVPFFLPAEFCDADPEGSTTPPNVKFVVVDNNGNLQLTDGTINSQGKDRIDIKFTVKDDRPLSADIGVTSDHGSKIDQHYLFIGNQPKKEAQVDEAPVTLKTKAVAPPQNQGSRPADQTRRDRVGDAANGRRDQGAPAKNMSDEWAKTLRWIIVVMIGLAIFSVLMCAGTVGGLTCAAGNLTEDIFDRGAAASAPDETP